MAKKKAVVSAPETPVAQVPLYSKTFLVRDFDDEAFDVAAYIGATRAEMIQRGLGGAHDLEVGDTTAHDDELHTSVTVSTVELVDVKA